MKYYILLALSMLVLVAIPISVSWYQERKTVQAELRASEAEKRSLRFEQTAKNSIYHADMLAAQTKEAENKAIDAEKSVRIKYVNLPSTPVTTPGCELVEAQLAQTKNALDEAILVINAKNEVIEKQKAEIKELRLVAIPALHRSLEEERRHVVELKLQFKAKEAANRVTNWKYGFGGALLGYLGGRK